MAGSSELSTFQTPPTLSMPFYQLMRLFRIPQAFSKEQAADITKNVWTRLGMDPKDKSTWHSIRTNMPSHNTFDAAQFAPRAWAAVCELCGGEVRLPFPLSASKPMHLKIRSL